MAFITIPPSLIQIGSALKKELFDLIKDNLDDLDSRVNALSLGAAPVEIFNFDVLNASSASTLTGLIHHEALSAFTITEVKIQLFETGGITSGTLSIDVKKGPTPDDLTMVSVLTTQPSINFLTAVNYQTATGVLDPAEQAVAQGEILRLDITSLPSTPLGKFRVLVYGVI
jgi:hypothetical protein